MELREQPHHHPLHRDHPLIPSNPNYDEMEHYYICSGCESPILSGPIFTCSDEEQGCKFVLHKSCAELPMQITHFSHTTQHPLTLVDKSPYESGNTYCDSCQDTIKGFVYHCSICEYDLDVMCASLKISYIQLKGEEDHKHKFIMVKPSPSTRCDICGKEIKGKSYLCTTCQARVHPDCPSLPRVVKLFTHSCPLKLISDHQLENPIDAINQFCRTCWKTVDTRYGFYYCVECKYIADIECTSLEIYRDYEFDVEANKASSMKYKDVGKIDLQTWHEHGLIQCLDEPKTCIPEQQVCSGCVSVISSAPFYECKEKCGYVLHESCANLYEKVRHPFHALHDLVLSNESPFICTLCGLLCNGFGYHCKQEGHELPVGYDIKCALRPHVIEKAHQHPLRIVLEREHNDKTCKGCGSGCDRARYSCLDPHCDYNICDRCVGLPLSAKHSWDEHPLVLTYESIPHEEEEYYCDQCEEPRDADHWFYHCTTCDRDVHPKCMGLHNLNLTVMYKSEWHPDHVLILATNPQFYPTCSVCDFPCKDLYLDCTECNYYVHFVCPVSHGQGSEDVTHSLVSRQPSQNLRKSSFD